MMAAPKLRNQLLSLLPSDCASAAPHSAFPLFLSWTVNHFAVPMSPVHQLPPLFCPAALCGHRPPLVHNATQPRSKIVGGSLASPGSWPWLVNLRLDGGLMCGGVLVDSSWVVTAAHCFSGSRSENQWTAVVGEFDITKSDPDEQIIKVNRIVTHPKFNPKTFNNDIGLVELMAPAMLSDRVRPVCLPSGPDPSTGTPCLVAGWGSLYEDGPSAEQVMEAKVPLLPQSTCRNALGKELVTNTMFCAGFLSGGVDSCQGDSGGPLIYQDKLSGRFHLYGITSWGDGCGEQGKPGVYTRVTAFADWIQAEMQKSAENREPTCPELLKTSELSEEQQRSEFGTLCRFYSQSCPQGQGAACSRLAEDKCRTRFKKCRESFYLPLPIKTLPCFSILKPKPLSNHKVEIHHNANLIRDMYRWVLRIPSKNLCMNFQEILVDLASKNKKGLYEARIQATVGGRPLTFYSLVGLENEAFYRSMPRVIALALEALKGHFLEAERTETWCWLTHLVYLVL
uniref:Serine protease 56 n=1 Tax=Scleropages formosus TaxID=113540 RepID=A0A8C9QZK5_SCLFO